MFQFAAGSNWLFAFFRTQILPSIAPHLIGIEPVRKLLFPLISQIGINYRHSALSQHPGDDRFKVKAGDRMPYFIVDGRSIYDKLHQPKFHWLVFADARADLPALKTELARQDPEVDCYILPLDPAVAKVFGSIDSFNLLLRPDNYIAFISTEISSNQVKTYLQKLTTFRTR
jgi:hypothetical protein